MTWYTPMPLELVLDGWSADRELLDVTVSGVRMQVTPAGPGVGRIVRLYQAPLELYLRPEYAPGAIVTLGNAPETDGAPEPPGSPLADRGDTPLFARDGR